ncbi:hypothetical protein YC2023_000832 [Brassica napus]
MPKLLIIGLPPSVKKQRQAQKQYINTKGASENWSKKEAKMCLEFVYHEEKTELGRQQAPGVCPYCGGKVAAVDIETKWLFCFLPLCFKVKRKYSCSSYVIDIIISSWNKSYKMINFYKKYNNFLESHVHDKRDRGKNRWIGVGTYSLMHRMEVDNRAKQLSLVPGLSFIVFGSNNPSKPRIASDQQLVIPKHGVNHPSQQKSN